MSLEFKKFVLGVNMAVVVLETALFALLLVAASTTLYLRFSRHKLPQLVIWNPVVLFTILISATSGAHWSLTIVRFFDAFLWSANAERFYLDNSLETQTARSLLSVMSVIIGDAAIIHRLWLIWNRSFPVIILPVMTCIGILIMGCISTYLSAQPVAREQLLSVPVERWVEASWIITLATNMYCTGLIVWKIWKMKRTVEHLLGDGTLVSVLIVLLESAAIWTIWGLFFAITNEIGSPVQAIGGDLSSVMVGLVNIVIYLRVELQCARPQGSDRTGVVMTSSPSIVPYFVNRASAQIPRGTV
ncbi:hypothetical protein B0H16DRAFT_1516383 [Mycena metata]|uniref:Uncharacterized protein n=1 Tax=Mycena metata TaxID=1033252 RepID=A0AAD7NQF1_9AGAR|nr:hypothetical protein B0H16DRAFT_1516383 [Mycena metata]